MKRRLKKLGLIHREIARRLLNGEAQLDIAGALEMSEASLSRIVNDPLFQTTLDRARQNCRQGIVEFREEIHGELNLALLSLRNALRDERVPARIRFQIARWVLDAALVRKEPH